MLGIREDSLPRDECVRHGGEQSHGGQDEGGRVGVRIEGARTLHPAEVPAQAVRHTHAHAVSNGVLRRSARIGAASYTATTRNLLSTRQGSKDTSP